MKKKCNVVMLPSNEEGSINLGYGNILYQGTSLPSDNKHKNQHLYIVSDDEIKEGDWFINELNQVWQHNGKVQPYKGSKKIIATTDTSLKIITGMVGSGTGVPLPQIPQQFIEHYVEHYNSRPFKNDVITEVMVKYEEILVPDYIAEGSEKVIDTVKINQDNTINIDVVKDSYSREEVIKLLADFNFDFAYQFATEPYLIKWIEENL